MQPLRIALTKGRLEKSTVQLFEQTGMDCSALREKGRKLILPVGDGSLQAVLAKAADVITYVEQGVCDMGVVGKDTIMENGSHFFESKAMDVRIIKIEGSVELAPLLGLSDGIVDIVETGATLRENGLEVVERIHQVSARLIVNAASLKLRKGEIEDLAARLEREIQKGEGK